jgi:hypothetical protein
MLPTILHCILSKSHLRFNSPRSTIRGPTKLKGSYQTATRATTPTCGPFRVYSGGRPGSVWMAEEKCGHHRYRGYFLSQGPRTIGAWRTSTSSNSPFIWTAESQAKAATSIAGTYRSHRIFVNVEND